MVWQVLLIPITEFYASRLSLAGVICRSVIYCSNYCQTTVLIDNDVNTFTLAERWFGSGQGVRDFLTITIGRGVGLGIVTNGQFYRGAGGGAGEFGHIVVDPEGPLCDCGKRGCLEALVSDPALLSQAQQAIAKEP